MPRLSLLDVPDRLAEHGREQAHSPTIAHVLVRVYERLAAGEYDEAERLIRNNVIDGGMLPKVESAIRALSGGAQKAHIIDGRLPHAILLEVLTKEGIGTEIVL